MANFDAAMDPREPLCPFDPPSPTEPHLSPFGDHPMGQHYMFVGYGDSVFLVTKEKELEHLLSWSAKIMKIRDIQPYG